MNEHFQKPISWFKTVKSLFELVGWWSPLVGAISAFGWAIWAYIGGLPLPIIVVGAVCLGVAVAFAVLFPKFMSLLTRGAVYRKPEYHLWQHAEMLHIEQAACLFADVGWVQGNPAPYPERARIWAHQIAVAVETGKIRNLSAIFAEDGPVDYGTKVSVDDLRVWAKEKGIGVPFFSYLAAVGAPIPPALQQSRSPAR